MNHKQYPQREQLRLPKYDYASPGYYFVTICTRVRQKDILSSVHPLPDINGRMKSYTQARYKKLGSTWGPYLWQEGYYDHILRNDADLTETRRYITQNPSAQLERSTP